jgi:hypothetical protein
MWLKIEGITSGVSYTYVDNKNRHENEFFKTFQGLSTSLISSYCIVINVPHVHFLPEYRPQIDVPCMHEFSDLC